MNLLNAINFTNLYLELSSQKVPFALAYKLNKINQIAKEAFSFYNEKLTELLNEYGEKDEDGNLKQNEQGFLLVPDTAAECHQKIKELQEVNWDIQNLYFSQKEEEMFENLDLTLMQMEVLFPFFSSLNNE